MLQPLAVPWSGYHTSERHQNTVLTENQVRNAICGRFGDLVLPTSSARVGDVVTVYPLP